MKLEVAELLRNVKRVRESKRENKSQGGKSRPLGPKTGKLE